MPFNQWVSLGTYFFPDTSTNNTVEVTSQTESFDAGRLIAADAVRFVRLAPTYLPDARGSGGWNSDIVVRSNGGDAFVCVSFYDSSGEQRCMASSSAVPARGVWIKDISSWCSYDVRSAVVYASQDVSVVVENQADSKRERTNYTGILPGGSGSLGWEQAGSTLYAPGIKRQRYGRSSIIHVTNAGAQSTTVYVYYYDDAGTARWGGSYSLSPNGKVAISPSGGGSGGCNGSGTICSARIYTSNGQPLAGVVQEYRDTDGKAVATTNMFSAGATSIYFPAVKYKRYNMSTGLRIQNVGSGGTTITVRYYQKNGTYQCSLSGYVPRFAAKTFLDSTCPGDNFAGSAVVTASQPLVGVAREASTDGRHKKAYSSFQAGSQTAYGPLVYHNYNQDGYTWNGGISVQNLSTQSANVTLRYYHGNGNPAGSQNQAVAGRGMAVFFAPQSGFKGSVLITADRDIVAVVHVVNDASNGDTHAIYNASNR